MGFQLEYVVHGYEEVHTVPVRVIAGVDKESSPGFLTTQLVESRLRDKLAELAAEMNEKINLTQKGIQDIKKTPHMFNCYRTSVMQSSGIVTYSDCNVDTTEGAMLHSTGTYTAGEAGVYQMVFMAEVY